MTDRDIELQELVVKELYNSVTNAREDLRVAVEAHEEARVRYWELVKDKTRTMCGHDGPSSVPGYLRQGFGP